MKFNKCIDKVCCFYASDWHLTVMLMPYINRNVKENKIYMEFENSIEDKFKTLLEKLDLKSKNEIKNIKWNYTVEEDEYCDKEKIFIVSGKENFINEKNKSIENFYKNKNEKIKIVNCYQINENEALSTIINRENYKKMLNTRGEFSIKKII
ncbi:MAG: hypothetical protein IKE01_01015 [Clostridia bacterium]|nr:hypothetical protein [Clostridia bacterium]MBR3199459.1 hypothetical protein [Bacilli bacterium]